MCQQRQPTAHTIQIVLVLLRVLVENIEAIQQLLGQKPVALLFCDRQRRSRLGNDLTDVRFAHSGGKIIAQRLHHHRFGQCSGDLARGQVVLHLLARLGTSLVARGPGLGSVHMMPVNAASQRSHGLDVQPGRNPAEIRLQGAGVALSCGVPNRSGPVPQRPGAVLGPSWGGDGCAQAQGDNQSGANAADAVTMRHCCLVVTGFYSPIRCEAAGGCVRQPDSKASLFIELVAHRRSSRIPSPLCPSRPRLA